MSPALTLPDGRSLALPAMPLVMGIVNITPDSFSDGGLLANAEAAVAHGVRLAGEGAAIVDIGGESTRPGHAAVDAATEMGRVLPVIAGLKARIDTPISIDSYKAEVAEAALTAGASIVNDVWGAQRDPRIAGVAARAGAPIILMHNRETIDASLDIFDDVLRFLERSIAIATEAGVPPSQIVVDPGIGFGKRVEDNLRILKMLHVFKELGRPVLIGTSMKSFIGTITDSPLEERVEGTLATLVVACMNGADIFRVHDVRRAKKVLTMVKAVIDT